MHAWQRLGLIGTHVVMMFANTVDDTSKSREANGIPDINTALKWGEAAGVLTRGESRRISAKPGLENYERLVELREDIWHTLHCFARSAQPDQRTLAHLDDTVRWAFADSKMVIGDSHFKRICDKHPDLLRKRLALAVDGLMRGPAIHRLRECERCTTLFLDYSRGRGRRYCRPNTCGNRAKVERFRAKNG